MKVLSALVVCSLLSLPALANYRVVAVSGAPTPGTTDSFRDFSPFARSLTLGNDGQVVFRALTDAATTDPRTGLWSDDGTGLRALVLEGDPAPGTRGAEFYSVFGPPVVFADNGTTMFATEFIHPVAHRDHGVWQLAPGGAPELLTRSGTHLPGLAADVTTRHFDRDVQLHPSGHFLFEGWLQGASSRYEDEGGVWVAGPNMPPQLFAQTSDPAPIDSDGDFFVYSGSSAINGNGVSVIVAQAAEAGSSFPEHDELWIRDANGNVSVLAKSSDGLPDMPSQADLESIAEVSINDTGQGIFHGRFNHNNETSAGLWFWSETGQLETIAVERQEAGLGGGEVFAAYTLNAHSINEQGQTAFSGRLAPDVGGVTTDNDTTLWLTQIGSDATLVAREGDPIAGIPGIEIGSVGGAHLNENGQLAYGVTLRGVGVDPANDGAIFVRGQNGMLKLIARHGDSIDVGTETTPDFRTIENLIASAFNDSGQLLFIASFTDGSDALVLSHAIDFTLSGDFDGDGDFECDDIDALRSEIIAATDNLAFDMNGDGVVSNSDIDTWLMSAGISEIGAAFLVGDVDFSGTVDSVDLGLMLNNFSDTAGLGWCSGNLNGDTMVDSSDLGLLLNSFNRTSIAASAAVPEPSSQGTLFIAICWTLLGIRHRVYDGKIRSATPVRVESPSDTGRDQM